MATSAGRGAAGDQHASDARDIVASVEGIPVAVKVGLKPGGEIHRAIRRRHADIAQVTGAVTRGDIHTATEGDGEVRVIAADAGPLLESLPGRLRGAGVLVTEGDMLMDEIADGLDAFPSGGRLAEEVPSYLGQQIGLAISAPQQEQHAAV